MATIEQRVGEYVGGALTGLEDELDTFSAHEARALKRELPAALLLRVASRTVVTDGTGFATLDKRVLRVSRAGYEVNASSGARVTLARDPHSLHFATKRSPVFYETVGASATTLYVLPEPTADDTAQVDYVGLTSEGNVINAGSDTFVSGLPAEAEEAHTLGVCARLMERIAGDARLSLPSFSFVTSVPSAPTGFSATTTIDLAAALTAVDDAIADDEEDPELARARLEYVQAALAEFNAEIQAEATEQGSLNQKYAAQIQAYGAEVSKAVQVFTSGVQKALAELEQAAQQAARFKAMRDAEVARLKETPVSSVPGVSHNGGVLA